MDEVACDPMTNVDTSKSFVRFNVTQVSNGYLVETKDKSWNGIESVHLNLDSVLEALKEAFVTA